jgi:hypothetical protein
MCDSFSISVLSKKQGRTWQWKFKKTYCRQTCKVFHDILHLFNVTYTFIWDRDAHEFCHIIGFPLLRPVWGIWISHDIPNFDAMPSVMTSLTSSGEKRRHSSPPSKSWDWGASGRSNTSGLGNIKLTDLGEKKVVSCWFMLIPDWELESSNIEPKPHVRLLPNLLRRRDPSPVLQKADLRPRWFPGKPPTTLQLWKGRSMEICLANHHYKLQIC